MSMVEELSGGVSCQTFDGCRRDRGHDARSIARRGGFSLACETDASENTRGGLSLAYGDEICTT